MRLSWPRPNRDFGFFDAVGVTGAAGLLVARFVPVAMLPFWRCVLREKTGWPCLGCGLTRAAEHVSRGNLGAAFAANPLGAASAILFAAAALWTALHLGFKVPVPQVTLTQAEARGGRFALAGLVVANYAYVILQVRFGGLP